jgi:hypothetical protein
MQGGGFHVALAVTQVVECQRAESTLCQAPHQREKLLCTTAPAVHEDNGRPLARLVGLYLAIVSLDFGLSS